MQALTNTLKSGPTVYPRLHIHFSERTRALLDTCSEVSSNLTGHRVSYSTTVRRALMLLAEHQKTLKTATHKTAERAELASAMVR